jgi:ABC-type transport system involved in multi-copper enzyme maturation permease subunit
MLPQSRGRIVLSKLLVALGCIGVLVLVNIAIMAASVGYWMWSIPTWSPSREFGLVLRSTRLEMALPFATFSIAWMFGRFTPSPAIAASSSIGVTMGVVFLMRDIIWQHGYRGADAAWGARCAINVGAFALLVGTIHYLRRVEP